MKNLTMWLKSICCVFLYLVSINSVNASEHREAPELADKPAADITDFYAFMSPADSSKLVMVIDVNGFIPPQAADTYWFSPEYRYIFNIDNNGDAIADEKIVFKFGEVELFESQQFIGFFPNYEVVRGEVTPAFQFIPEPIEPIIFPTESGIKVFAGQRDDPFFFDSVDSAKGFLGLGKFSNGIDRFAGFNVSALVVEIPVNTVYKGTPLQIWSTVEQKKKGSYYRKKPRKKWEQIQRVGNPAIKPVYIPRSMRQAYNRTKPHKDKKNWQSTIVGFAKSAFQLDDDTVNQLVSIVVPDTIKLDPTKPSVFPNGRNIKDDIDLSFWFNLNSPLAFSPGNLDGVTQNDLPFSDEFPYLAAPHVVPF